MHISCDEVWQPLKVGVGVLIYESALAYHKIAYSTHCWGSGMYDKNNDDDGEGSGVEVLSEMITHTIN